MRGQKPKSVEQHRRNGNPSKKALPAVQEALPAGEFPIEPPEDLSETAAAFWRQVVPVLNEVGLLSAVDVAALELMCESYAQAKQAQRVINRDGHLIAGHGGVLREHPEIKIKREATAIFMRIADEFALTPTARTRLGLAELQRRSMAQEIDEEIGPPVLEAVE